MNVNLAVFSTKDSADDAVNELVNTGYNPKQISLIIRGEEGENRGDTIVSKTAQGAKTGGVIGGLAGLLVGLSLITLPGLGGLFIAGPLATALGLSGTLATTVSGAVTGALAGGIVGALVGLGIPEETAKRYESTIRAGGVLLAVPVMLENSVAESKDILEKHGASQISTVNLETQS
jgi:uncharacterized membrane protein